MSCFEYGMERRMVERCALSGADLAVQYRVSTLERIK